MSTSPYAGRSSSARRQLFAIVTAAFIVLQPGLFVSRSAAIAQLRRAEQTMPTVRISPSISITTLGMPITQNFDTLATAGTANAWADDSTLTGWYSQFSLQPASPTTYRADSGGSNTGAIYSWGVAGTNPLTERAFGSLASGTPGDIYNAVRLTNNSGSTITSFDISYTGEQWRNGGNVNAQQSDFQYQVVNLNGITDANTPSTGWLDFDPLDFVTPTTGAAIAALDGNAAANRTAKSGTLVVTVNAGQEIWLRWRDINDAGNDHGVAVDDFSVTPQGAGGGMPTLNINDVTQAEGDAGTSTFTFTVSLTQPAGPGGVTFDIATADGTAQDDNPPAEDNDYVANTLSGQTILAGNSTYTFNVTVNGDTSSEPNETFFVNVTNITGANAGDAQGQGTITNDDFVLTPIHDIQGSGTASPFDGQVVTTTGIVTLLRTGTNNGGPASGFFLQAPDAGADADPNTSEGILVFTSSVPTVAVGDAVSVTGTVDEFFEMTEITSVTNVSVTSTGNPLPAAVVITPTILDPAAPPTQPQLEKFEGMRMSALSLASVASNDNFFDVDTVLGGVPRPLREPGIEISQPVPPDPTSGVPDCCIPRWDENPERLSLDTNARAGAPLNPYTSNVTFSSVTGPLDFSFARYRLIPDSALSASANMSAIPVPSPNANEFTVGGFNIENFNNNATQRQKAALAIRDVMRLPHIIGHAEIFELSGLQALAAEINAISPGHTYVAHLIEADGTSGDADQDVGFLVDTSRVQINSVTQIELAGCDGTAANCNTYIDPNTGMPALLNDRPPLVLDANIDPSGANLHVIVVMNHTRSFIDIELVTGEGPRVRAKRKAQGEFLADLLQDLQTNNPTTSVISVGDYNAYQFNDGYTDPIATIKGNPTADDQVVVDQSPDLVNPNFSNLIDELLPGEQYSFIFEGTPQALDHVIVNTVAHARVTRIAIARNNPDFPEIPAAAFASNAARPERCSDHDMPVAYFSLGEPQPSGSFIISEYRLRGSGNGGEFPKGRKSDVRRERSIQGGFLLQENDEFIEFYNNTDSAITVQTVDGSSGWSLVASDGIARFTIPNGTVIPARGHYLATNSVGYSLTNYPGGNDGMTERSSAGDIEYKVDIADQAGLALFNTSDPANFNEAHRLDAVGYDTAPALYREGTGFQTASPGAEVLFNLEYSFLRDLRAGTPRDTQNNTADFIPVDTSGQMTSIGTNLGAPGPENLFGPIRRLGVHVNRLDPAVGQNAAPNRVRDLTPVPNGQQGTLSIRRKVVNNTGAPVTRLRFRIIEITTLTFPPVAGQADVRALTSGDITVTLSDGMTMVPVQGTALEIPAFQPNGGGWNTSWSPTGEISLASPLPAGDSINVQFLLGVETNGSFRIFINVEALP